MNRYRNNPEGFTQLRKQILIKTIPLMLIILAGGLTISYFSQDGLKEGLGVVFVYTGIIAAVLTFSVFRTIKRQQAVFDSFELTIGSDYFLRKQQGLPDKTIYFNEVDTITETANGFLGIKGATADNSIFIAPYLNGYDGVKQLLQGVRPFTYQQKKSLLAKHPLLPGVTVCALMAAVYMSQNKIVVTVSGLLLIGILIWSFYKTRASSLVDQRIKSSLWMVWIVIISLALIVYFKVFGGLG